MGNQISSHGSDALKMSFGTQTNLILYCIHYQFNLGEEMLHFFRQNQFWQLCMKGIQKRKMGGMGSLTKQKWLRFSLLVFVRSRSKGMSASLVLCLKTIPISQQMSQWHSFFFLIHSESRLSLLLFISTCEVTGGNVITSQLYGSYQLLTSLIYSITQTDLLGQRSTAFSLFVILLNFSIGPSWLLHSLPCVDSVFYSSSFCTRFPMQGIINSRFCVSAT